MKKIQHDHQGHEDETTYQLVPPDGGWGWMVALGTFIIMTLVTMLVTCFGVIFSEYLLGAGASSTTTAWIFNLNSFLGNATGLLAWPLTQEFGWRRVALVGTAMAAVGLMASAFTPSPSFLFFSFSLLTGLGGGVVICQCLTILPHYFQRRRGLANGIMSVGICAGQLIFSPFTSFLQTSYGFRGSTLILGGLMLNACVGASFFHPVEWHQKRVLLEGPKEDMPALTDESKDVGSFGRTRGLVHSPSGTSIHSDYGRTFHGGYETQAGNRKEERCGILPVRVGKALIRDLGALKSMRVCILCLGNALCLTGYINFTMMVPFAMLETGFPLEVTALCLSLSAGCNTVARFLVSAFSDWPRFNKRLVYMGGFALISASIFVFTVLSSLDWLLVTMAVFGIGVGGNVSIYPLVIIDVMGVERLGPVFGTASLSMALGFICLGPLIGFIRDVTQSYAASMRFTGGMLLVSLISWLFMGLAERVDRRRELKTLREALKTSRG